MTHVSFSVETLACEASADDVLSGLLAREGVLDARVDLEGEEIRVDLDERRAKPRDVADALAFYGIAVKSTHSAQRAAFGPLN